MEKPCYGNIGHGDAQGTRSAYGQATYVRGRITKRAVTCNHQTYAVACGACHVGFISQVHNQARYGSLGGALVNTSAILPCESSRIIIMPLSAPPNPALDSGKSASQPRSKIIFQCKDNSLTLHLRRYRSQIPTPSNAVYSNYLHYPIPWSEVNRRKNQFMLYRRH